MESWKAAFRSDGLSLIQLGQWLSADAINMDPQFVVEVPDHTVRGRVTIKEN